MDSWLEIKSQIEAFCRQNDHGRLKVYLESLLAVDDSNPLLLAYGGVCYMLADEEERAIALWLDCFLLAQEKQLEIIAENLAQLANLYFENHQFYEASLIYQQVLEFNPSHFQSYLNGGYSLLCSGNFDQGIDIWKNGLSINNQSGELYLNIAREYQYIKEYSQGISYYLKALNFYPNDDYIFYNLGLCYGAINELDTAIGYHQNCLEINPNFAPVYGELGYLYLLKGDIALVKENWQRLLRFNSHIFTSYLGWSDGNKDKLISLNRQLIANLLSDDSLLQLGAIASNIFFERKQYNLASKYYQLSHLEEKILTEEIKTIDGINKLDFQGNNVQNYYETSQDWASKINLKENYQLIYQDNKLKLTPPQNLDNTIHPSFYFPPNFPLPPSFVITVKKGRFWLRKDESSSAIITKDNHLLGDISPESPALSPNHPDKHPSYHSLLKTSHLPHITSITGTVVVLGGLLNNIYFHWLFDILPRIHLLEKISINWDDVDYVVVDNRCQFQQETLEIFGIPTSKILPLSFPTHIEADKLIVPSFPSAIAWMPPWSCEYLRTKILGDDVDKKTPHKRIYISREKSSNRRLINELEIVAILQQYNFDIVNLELLSVRQQAELLNQAEIVISPHGSGLSNLVFCQPKTKIIELFSPHYVYPCYWLVSNILQLEYQYILGEVFGSKSFDNFLYPDSRFEDIYLNPTNLKEVLKDL